MASSTSNIEISEQILEELSKLQKKFGSLNSKIDKIEDAVSEMSSSRSNSMRSLSENSKLSFDKSLWVADYVSKIAYTKARDEDIDATDIPIEERTGKGKKITVRDIKKYLKKIMDSNEDEEVKQCEGICTSRTGICGNKGTIVCGTKFYCPLHIEDGIQLYESEKKLDEKNAKRKKAKEEAIKEVEKTLEIKPKDDSDNSDDESPFVKKQLELKIVKPKNKEKSVDKIKKNIKLPTLSLDKLDDIEEDDEDDNFSLEENIEDDEDIIEEEPLEDADNEDLEDEDYIPDFNDNISEYNSE